MIGMMALPTEDNRGETRSMTRFQTDLRLHCSGGQGGRSHRPGGNSPDTLVSPWEDKLSVLPLGWLFSTPMMVGLYLSIENCIFIFSFFANYSSRDLLFLFPQYCVQSKKNI